VFIADLLPSRKSFYLAVAPAPGKRHRSDIAGGADVGGQPHAGKSRLREFTLSLGAFNLRMQAFVRCSHIRQDPCCFVCRASVRIGTDEGASRAHDV